MGRLTKQIFAALAWFVYCILVLIFAHKIPLEFAWPVLKNSYYILIFGSLPIVFVWTAIQLFRIKNPTGLIIITCIISIPVLALLALAHSMCENSSEIIYQDKDRPSQVIVKRSFGCGAYDSDFPEYHYYKVVPLAGLFYYVTLFDTTHLNKAVWVKRNGKGKLYGSIP